MMAKELSLFFYSHDWLKSSHSTGLVASQNKLHGTLTFVLSLLSLLQKLVGQ